MLIVGEVTKAQGVKYQFPIKPNQQNFMAGGTAEMRANHFHGGLDIKTEGRIGLPIYAIADGYVCRIRESSYGYGKVIYLMHENGYYSVYAHLNAFTKPLEEYVLKRQYMGKSFAVDTEVEEGLFAFKQGEVIGYSGNTGSSGGPHLHFEIRTPDEIPVDPLLFGYKQIKDSRPPEVFGIRLETLHPQSTIEGGNVGKSYSLARAGRLYHKTAAIKASGLLGIEVKTYDRSDGVRHRYGVNYIKMYLDDELIYEHAITGVPFHMNRQKHLLSNYKEWQKNRGVFTSLYIKDGNTLPIYPDESLDGKIFIAEGEVKFIRIELSDVFGNTSRVRFKLEGESQRLPEASSPPHTFENWLCALPKGAVVRTPFGSEKVWNGYYDMRNGLPTSLELPDADQIDLIDYVIPSGQKFTYYSEQINLHFSDSSLFDTLYLSCKPIDSVTFNINDFNTPLGFPVEVSYRPKHELGEFRKQYTVYRLSRSGHWVSCDGEWINGRYVFTTKELGKFKLRRDNIRPYIRPISASPYGLRFKVYDRMSGIKSYEAKLDGEFILMKFDHRKAIYWTKFPPTLSKLQGEFVFTVEDYAGNISTYRRSFR